MNRINVIKATFTVLLIGIAGLIIFNLSRGPEVNHSPEDSAKGTKEEKASGKEDHDKGITSIPPFKIVIASEHKPSSESPNKLNTEDSDSNTDDLGSSGKRGKIESFESRPEGSYSVNISELSSEEQKKVNEKANSFVLAGVINRSDADSEPGDGKYGTGAIIPTPDKFAENRKTAKKLKQVILNKIGLARINAERMKKGLPGLVAGRDVQVAPIGKDAVLSTDVEKDISQKLLEMKATSSTPQMETVTAAADSETIAFDPEPELPSVADNSTLQYFPPIRSQGSIDSCTQWAEIYYNMTHEVSMIRDWDAKTGGDDYRFSPMFTYNFLNNGANSGTSSSSGWNVAKDHGVSSWSDFYTTDVKAWPTNPDVYRNAINQRIKDTPYYIEIDDINTSTGLEQLKSHLNNGHIAVYSTFINSWQYKTVSDDASIPYDDTYTGESVAYSINGSQGPHAMTVVGYNDNIWCDIDGDSVVDANEKGALKIANSWGTGWKNSGFCWVSYDAVLNHGIFSYDYVYYLPVTTSQSPKVVARITISHSQRNYVGAKLGTGSIGSGTPTATTYSRILSGTFGGPYAFDGSAPTLQDYTHYLDFSDLVPEEGTATRWFLQVSDWDSEDTPATVKSFELYLVQPGGDVLVGSASNLPVVVSGSTGYVWIDWTYQTPDNFPPVAQDQNVSTDENADLAITLVATDPEDDDLTYTVNDPLHGTLDGTAPNLTYTPDANYSGSDSFTWKVNDGTTDSNTATCTIDVVEFVPEISVTATDASAAEEGQDTGTWTITRTGTGANISVALNVIFSLNGTATEIDDYSIGTSTPVTIPAGQSSVSITLTPVDDSIMDEGTETASLTIEPESSYTIGTSTAIVNITENDTTTYTVSYNGNGHTGGTIPANQDKAHNIDLALAVQGSMIRAGGYLFAGWNTAADGTGIDYAAGATYSDNSPITLYAQWSQTITLLEEGFESPDVSAYTKGQLPDNGKWVGSSGGFGSDRKGITDKGAEPGGDYDDPRTETFQAFAFRYTNSGITSAEGVIGPLESDTTYNVIFEAVRDDGLNSGTPYNCVLYAVPAGTDLSPCNAAPTGSTVLASAAGDAPGDGSFATVNFEFTPEGGTHDAVIGQELVLRFYGATDTAIIDNVKVQTVSAIQTYALTVNNGTGSGSYAETAQVAITATVPGGQHFVNWTGDTANLADSNNASTTVTMPASAVTVTANFAAGDTAHSADTNSDWSISQSEAESFISAYNSNNNTATTANGDITANRITMREVMRVIFLHNDGGEYIGGQGTVDGYDIAGAQADPASAQPELQVAGDSDGNLVVSSTADSGVGSLRDAIAIAADGETITIDDSLGIITVLSEIVIDKSITIDGQGAAIVSGEDQTRIFRIENSERDIDVTLKNMGITDAENSADEFGGAIYNNAQTITIDTVLLDGNSNSTENGKGGAVYSSGILNVENCEFRNNTASEKEDIFEE